MSEDKGGTQIPLGEVVEGAVHKHGEDPRMVVHNGIAYVPNEDLTSMKDSLTRQRDEALAASSQAKETNITLESQVSDFQSKLGLAEGTLDEARKQILATQDGLTAREVALRKEQATLETSRQEFATRTLTQERERISKQYGVDEEILKEFKDTKDMEIMALKKMGEKSNQNQVLPKPDSITSGGSVGNVSDPHGAALTILQNAKHVGPRNIVQG